jgi:hypothetical protein
MSVSFEDWTRGRTPTYLGTNTRSTALPFQSWRPFKEAFAPEFVQRAVSESVVPVRHCVDPFAGSGTTALACQFLGIRPTTIEVNPFLADLVEAKLCTYDLRTLAKDFALLVRSANAEKRNLLQHFKDAPATFVEPGLNGRWIFNRPVAKRIAAYVKALSAIRDPKNKRLFKVLLGGILVPLSNVTVSGKGRRYRQSWTKRQQTGNDFDQALCDSIYRATLDIVAFSQRAELSFTVLRGDCRSIIGKVRSADLAVFSPPYPNSFDYTDIYNIELWSLGYLRDSQSNHRLRNSTLTSHVQIKRAFAPMPEKSNTLRATIESLNRVRSRLWNRNIPEMVAGYFADMYSVIVALSRQLISGAQMWIVVGESRYEGVHIPVATILSELARSANCRKITEEPFRSMRVSPQQGGDPELEERLIVLAPNS